MMFIADFLALALPQYMGLQQFELLTGTVLRLYFANYCLFLLTLDLQNLSDYDIKSLRISQESKRYCQLPMVVMFHRHLFNSKDEVMWKFMPLFCYSDWI